MHEPELLSLHRVAERLELGEVRLYRLGRSFGLAPSDACIPPPVVDGALQQSDHESRYRIILQWLVAHGPSQEAKRARGRST